MSSRTALWRVVKRLAPELEPSRRVELVEAILTTTDSMAATEIACAGPLVSVAGVDVTANRMTVEFRNPHDLHTLEDAARLVRRSGYPLSAEALEGLHARLNAAAALQRRLRSNHSRVPA
ncbi:hypothetical protein [Variovorax paradoxus]|uniref:hypothetical protein n=1 Tax=Variovorax paradoxus TaxID=34073 RepID=UPI00247FE189|nr:hypothetical protein [Variovorax paradoxus]WGT64965.1 hypothetical protein QHG62_06385 [Variovorax paradoxus]